MRKKLPTIFLVLIFLVGLSLLLYPTVSDYWNSLHQTRAVTDYAGAVSELNAETYEEIWKNAKEYNKKWKKRSWNLELTNEKEIENYESQLDVTGTGMMGYIEIPKIDCLLPIYHGTDEGTLARNIGHIAGSSLPVGGKSTHCVLSGHRGLPSARLFTDLDQLVVGDTFMLHVLDETLTYEVDQILIVRPEEISSLAITKGEDYCTLVTCTPYGVNSHRLLVRGHRIHSTVRVSGDAIQLTSGLIAPLVAVPILLILLIVLLVRTRRRK